MAKRTAKMLANFAILATITLFFVGVIFADRPAFVLANEVASSTSVTTDCIDEVDSSESIDSAFLTDSVLPPATFSEDITTGPISLGSAASNIEETQAVITAKVPSVDIDAVQPPATTTEPVATTTDPVATTTDPVATTTDPVATTTPPVATTTDPVATTTPPVATTTDPIATTTNPVATTTNPVATSTATTTETFGGGRGDGTVSSSTATTTLSLLSVASSTASSTLATTTATTTNQKWRAQYYRYTDLRTDMVGAGIPFSEIQGIDFGNPLSPDFGANWFSSRYFSREEIQNGLLFGEYFVPFNHSTDPILNPEGFLVGDNFGARFMGLAHVEVEGDYTYQVVSDGDMWFYVDGQLDAEVNSGIKDAETVTRTIHMVPGRNYVLNLFFAERLAVYPFFNFAFVTPGVHIDPCADDTCTPTELNPDSTGPTAPIITSSTQAENTTSANHTVTITWSDSYDPVIPGDETSGLAGYSYAWSHDASGVTPGAVLTVATTSTDYLADGVWYFHVIAIDNSANQSSPITNFGPITIGDNGTTTDNFFIKNIRVTDITPTSAIIHWRTENPDGTGHLSDSRVIYDTASHPDISGFTAPNFGYVYSTVTSDAGTKVIEHTVQVTNLTPATRYYFRVLSQGSPLVISDEFMADANDDGDDDNDDNTGPTQPVIIHSINLPNATTTNHNETIVWSTSTDPVIAGHDTTGLKGYSFIWDHTSNTIPDNTVDTDLQTYSNVLGNGSWIWFHIKAIDNAGNVSATTHYGPIVINDGSGDDDDDDDEGSFITPSEPTHHHGGGGGTSRTVATTTIIATSTPELTCDPYLKKFIRLGEDNDPIEVKKLQLFLKEFEKEEGIVISGIYDLPTYEAVKRFQAKYGLDVLNPWGIGESTGYVFITTTMKINLLYCDSLDHITLDLRNVYGNDWTPTLASVDQEVSLATTTATTTATTSTSTCPQATSTVATRGFLMVAAVGFLGFLGDYLWLWLPLLLIALLVYFWDRQKEEEDDISSTNPPVVPPKF